jgi:hypothetical protein
MTSTTDVVPDKSTNACCSPRPGGVPGTRYPRATSFKISDTSYGIVDTFETDEARDAHLGGQIPQALGQVAPELLASDPDIRTIDIIAVK